MRVSELPRPSPERLLRQAQAEENKRWGARLKIFLGYAPGVGKSYPCWMKHDADVSVVKTLSLPPSSPNNLGICRRLYKNWS
jgi:hypothetical protein